MNEEKYIKSAENKLNKKSLILQNILKTKSPRILILGGNSFVGFNIMKIARKEGLKDVFGTYNSNNIEGLINYKILKNNLLNSEDLIRVLNNTKPDIIINCIAISKPKDCKDNPEKAKIINSEFIKVLLYSVLFTKLDCKIIHISSEQVANSKKINKIPENYIPENPKLEEVYSYTKWLAENYIKKYDKNNIFKIIRLPLIVGRSSFNNSWDYEIIENINNNKKINVFYDEKRSFALIDEVAYSLLMFSVLCFQNKINSKHINITGPKSISRLSFVKELFNVYKIKKQNLIQKTKSKNMPNRTKEFFIDKHNASTFNINPEINIKEAFCFIKKYN